MIYWALLEAVIYNNLANPVSTCPQLWSSMPQLKLWIRVGWALKRDKQDSHKFQEAFFHTIEYLL